MDDLPDNTIIQAAELRSEIVRATVAYWRSKCRNGALPGRAELDPTDIPRLLPHLMLQDVRRDPWDFRYRLIGTTVREHSRGDWTGRWMSEIPGQDETSTVFRVTRWACEHEAPAFFRPPYIGPHKEFKYCEAALLPWTGPEGRIDHILIAVEFLTA